MQSLFLCLWLLTSVGLAERLSFHSPPNQGGDPVPVYYIGDAVHVSWKSDFRRTSLYVHQGPTANGTYVSELLVGGC